MTKTRLQVLEEIHDKVFSASVDAEIQIEMMKTRDPKMVIYPNREVVMAGIRTKQDWTAEMVIKHNEIKIKEDASILEVIKKMIEKEKEPRSTIASPSGPTS